MCLKIFILSLIVFTSCVELETSLPLDISTYQQEVEYFNDSQSHISAIANHINGILRSLNLSDIEVNINLNHLEREDDEDQQRQITYNDITRSQFESSLTYLFKNVLGTNWYKGHILQEVAEAANNLTVYEILYATLWQELKEKSGTTNPFLYISLYEDLKTVMENFTSDKLTTLHQEIQTDLVKCSGQILQSYFIQNSTISRLLAELKRLDDMYEKTIPLIFQNLKDIENPWRIPNDLLEFDSQTQEAVYNHITYIQYLKADSNNIIPHKLYENLELVIARPDFVNISQTQRQKWSTLLPTSMANLFSSQKLCLRNATTNYYLFECPQTYLMCTNAIVNNVSPINRKTAAFDIARLGNGLYTLRSPYWRRYFHLQSNSAKNATSLPNNNNNNGSANTTTIANIVKNLYSHAEQTPWVIKFEGNYATIQDETKNFYVCAGDSSHWNKMEKYAYTRPSADFYKRENECQWLLEDCSDVV